MNQATTGIEGDFKQFSLDPKLARGIEDAGFEKPRPIQAETIPPAIDGRDILGLAQTGTGKTAAFVVPIIERLLSKRRPGPSALVLAPTRELATQIHADFERLAKHTRLKAVTVYGGVSEKQQVKDLRRQPEVIIACPGRLLDLSEQGKVMLARVRTFVLDEADQMFDMGFLPDVESIIALLPNDRQNLLFAATMPREIRGLANRILSQPHVVELAHTKPAETIEHVLYQVPKERKLALLNLLLRSDDCRSAIVFARTRERAKKLGQRLLEARHNVATLEGDMTQLQRDRAIDGFRAGKFKILVATDIASRGIDIAGVSHVINYDVPNSAEVYTHRIGRTGRSEREGKAFTLATPADTNAVRSIERGVGSKIRREPLPNPKRRRSQSEDRPHRKPRAQSNSAEEAPRVQTRRPGARRRTAAERRKRRAERSSD